MAKDNCVAFSASNLGFKWALLWIMELAFSGRKPHNNCGSYFFNMSLSLFKFLICPKSGLN